MHFYDAYLITKPKLPAFLFTSTKKFGQISYSGIISFLNKMTFKSFISKKPATRPWTDALRNYGIDGYIVTKNKFFSSLAITQLYFKQFTFWLRSKRINIKKMTAILQVLQKWLLIIWGSHLIFYCNNFAVAANVRKISIYSLAMYPLRAIAILAAINDV